MNSIVRLDSSGNAVLTKSPLDVTRKPALLSLEDAKALDVAKMTEKMRRPNFGTLQIELTIDDPKVYTRPFTVNLTQTIEADTELIDEFCLEGEKDYERLQRIRAK